MIASVLVYPKVNTAANQFPLLFTVSATLLVLTFPSELPQIKKKLP